MGKQQPLGICDHCLGPIPADEWYTSRGKPRLYCSVDCRNTANSRAGNAVRTEKLMERIERGQWTNPADIHRADPERVGLGVRRVRLHEVKEGRWRNPALTPEARAINSRPRKHTGALASAIEKLGAGKHVYELTEEEQEAHRTYRRAQQKALQASLTEAEREKRREQYRRAWHKKRTKPT